MPTGGSSGSTDQNITYTQTNPVVPERAKPLSNALLSIATALTGSPVNFGPTSIDAPRSATPLANIGSLLSSPAFQLGMNRFNITGSGTAPGSNAPTTAPPGSTPPISTPTPTTPPGTGAGVGNRGRNFDVDRGIRPMPRRRPRGRIGDGRNFYRTM